MRILGIDPGLATVGLGLVERLPGGKIQALEWLTITTKAGLPLPDRLMEIHNDLTAFLRDAKLELAVVERLFFQTNVKTAIDVAHARGAILLTLAEAAIPLLEPNPLELKLAITGDGRADKRAMQEMIARSLGLKEIPKPDDAADALALAYYGAVQTKTVSMLQK